MPFGHHIGVCIRRCCTYTCCVQSFSGNTVAMLLIDREIMPPVHSFGCRDAAGRSTLTVCYSVFFIAFGSGMEQHRALFLARRPCRKSPSSSGVSAVGRETEDEQSILFAFLEERFKARLVMKTNILKAARCLFCTAEIMGSPAGDALLRLLREPKSLLKMQVSLEPEHLGSRARGPGDGRWQHECRAQAVGDPIARSFWKLGSAT